MNSSRRYIYAGIILVVALLAGFAWAARVRAPVAESSSTSPLSPLQSASLRPFAATATSTPIAISPSSTEAPTFTPVVVTAPVILAPNPTVPPFPTAMPTPIVTPIPTITPPYIEGLAPQPTKPYWIYWAQGDEIWRIDNQGDDPELIVNTFAATGNHLVGEPSSGGSDCCVIGPYFTVAPNQQKLALVVIDQARIDAETKMRGNPPYGAFLATYLYDMTDHSVIPFGSGNVPLWSPDSKQVAFWHEGGLWIANPDTGEALERVQPNPSEGLGISAAWSPDGTQLAYVYGSGYFTPAPTIWVLNLADGSKPKAVLTQNPGEIILGPEWSPDGKSIYYLSPIQNGNLSDHFQNLWRVSLLDGVRQPMTTDMVVGSFGFLPGQPWIYLSGLRVFEGEDNHYADSVWLLNSNDGALRRLTGDDKNSFAFNHTPEGASLLGYEDDIDHPHLLSLVDGSITPLDERIGHYFTYGGAK